MVEDKYRIKITPKANDDLDEIYSYIVGEVFNENAAENLMDNSKNVAFRDMVAILGCYGFNMSRVTGSHHVFINTEVKEIINIQNVSGQVKPYQVKQFLKLVEKYNFQAKGVE